MGQQQLLLLALSSIIVGLAIVVGLNMFSESAGESNLNAVTNDVLTIAARAQSWARKPAIMGGGGRSFTGISFARLGIDSTNPSGSYAMTVSGTAGDSLTVVGTGIEDLDGNGTPLTVSVTVTPDNSSVTTITR